MHKFALGVFATFFLLTAIASADEGMWLFNAPPRDAIKKQYGFDLTDPWLNHLMRSAVRFNSGGSGSFVSSDGLIITNHHIGADALQKLSSSTNDMIASGFLAKSRDQELKCLDLELNVLDSIEDVTARVTAAVDPRATVAQAEVARRAILNTIEQESTQATGFRSDVVTLFQGAKYHLYRYKKYTDVRLVFAPEYEIAFFGGDPDNFEYPRFDLDICLFRAYENGKPAHIKDYLSWTKNGVKENDLIFVAGNPGHTDRMNTVAQLKFARDRDLPERLTSLRREEVLLRTYADRTAENARRAHEYMFGVQNSRKNRLGKLAALQEPSLFAAKTAEEEVLWKKAGTDPWTSVERALDVQTALYEDLGLYRFGSGFNATTFDIALKIVQLTAELEKPNADRLREFRESNLDSFKEELFSPAPIYNDLETLTLADSLSYLMEKKAGTDDDLVPRILAGKSPRHRAAELIANTKVTDVDFRKQLVAGGFKAVQQSDDPMIQLALLVDPKVRQVRKTYEQQVEEPMRQAHALIAAAHVAAFGTNTYPDATFTLRLAYGQVKGCTDSTGINLPPWTTLDGAFTRATDHQNTPPFHLPASWLAAKSSLNLATPMNFISTADIVGGNSGSPVVNRAGEFVGIIFDGNLESLGLSYAYQDKDARAVSVDARGILEALRHVYNATSLVEELEKR